MHPIPFGGLKADIVGSEIHSLANALASSLEEKYVQYTTHHLALECVSGRLEKNRRDVLGAALSDSLRRNQNFFDVS